MADDWFVRESRDDELFGPMSYRHANDYARHLSSLEDRSGLAEVVRVMSTSNGDPSRRSNSTFVVHMYIRGKLVLSGRAAQYHSDNRLPPTV